MDAHSMSMDAQAEPHGFRGLVSRLRGGHAERHVARIVDALGEDGWSVLHGVQTDSGRIDHLLVGPAGLIVVETRSTPGRRRAPDTDPKPLKQAFAQRRAIERLTGRPADCMLVFSRARVEPEVSRQHGVCVLSAKTLAGHLRRRPRLLARDEVAALDARVRDALAAI